MTSKISGALFSAALLSIVGATVAEAAPRDMSRHPVCASFARGAVQWNGKAKGLGCRLAAPFVSREGDYYNWCMGTSDAEFRVRSPQALGHKKNLENFCSKQLGRALSLDQPQSPPGRDASRQPTCSSFARFGTQWRDAAMAQGCNVLILGNATFSFNQQQLFDYCMGTSDAEFRGRSAQALGAKSALEKGCSKQIGRAIKL